MHPGVRGIGATLPALLLLACGDHPTTVGPSGAGLGAFCTSAVDCNSRFCLFELSPPYCSARCSSAAECGDLTCGVRPDGSKACLNPCSSIDLGYTCQNGVPTACELAGPESCADCGCPIGSRCQAGVGCGPLGQVGETCAGDADCQTGNCSQFAGVCRVGLGQACLADNCDLCRYDATGWSFCSRECSGLVGCNYVGQCLGDTLTNVFTCRPSCSGLSNPSCPGTCKYAINTNTNSGYYYCDCPSCQSVAPKRDLGQICRYPSDCTSGACQAPLLPSCGVSDESYCGTCTKVCSTDADCGGGLVCAMVCATPDAGSCGSVCLPTCAANQTCTTGRCRMVTAAAGASVMACDGRRDVGGGCIDNTDCLTARCVLGTCAPADGLANGAACGVPSDCKSGSCVDGHCKGTSPIGGSCAAIIDCASGTCCSNVCKTAC